MRGISQSLHIKLSAKLHSNRQPQKKMSCWSIQFITGTQKKMNDLWSQALFFYECNSIRLFLYIYRPAALLIWSISPAAEVKCRINKRAVKSREMISDWHCNAGQWKKVYRHHRGSSRTFREISFNYSKISRQADQLLGYYFKHCLIFIVFS